MPEEGRSATANEEPMNCIYCGYFHENPAEACERCGAELPDPTCQQCGTEVAWGVALCEQCEQMSQSADKTPCPSCGAMNNVSAEYCTSCGTPMAVITQITELARSKDREPLQTWRVYGVETEMVGRDEPLERLDEGLSWTIREESPKVIGVTGETGIGKSRLLAEFQRYAEQQYADTVVMESAGRDDSSGPFSLFARLFKNRYYIGEDESPTLARKKFREAVASIVDGSKADRIARRVGHIIGVPIGDSTATNNSADGPDFDRKSVEAMAELLSADARENPIVMVLEDLQYAKSQSLRLLDRLMRSVDDIPILFVLSWNPKDLFYDQIVEELPVDERIGLKPLSDDEVETFVRQTLHRAGEVPGELVEQIVESAHGVPLSVEEMLRILISDGVIDTRKPQWEVHEERIGETELPTTVEETVRARLDALTADEREVLDMAACIGNAFWPEALRALFHLQADHDDELRDYWFGTEIDDRLDELVESLERKDMVRRQDDSDLGNHEQLYFKHRIERRTVYGEIPGQTKQRYHRLIAQWLDRQVEEESGRAAEQIAEHYDKGHALDRAARMYIRAGTYARERFANEKAIDLFTKGLGYLSDADMALKLSAFHDLGSVYERRGEYDQALAYFREMLRYSWLINEPSKGGAALNKIGRAYRGLGEYDEALRHLERALDLFWNVSDLRGVASTLDDIGKIDWVRGEYDEALRYYSGGLQLRRETGDRRSIALSLSNIGSLKLQRGDLQDAMEYYREALELRSAIDDKQGVADSYNTLGALCLERGDTGDAITLFEEALEIAQNVGHRVMIASYLNNLGEAHLKAGDLDRAREYLMEAREAAERAGEKRVLFDVFRNLGSVALEGGEPESAHDSVEDALELAEELDSDSLRGLARLTMADVYAGWSRRENGEALETRAERNYRDSIELLREVGNRAKLGRCYSHYGNFLLDRGDAVQGKQNLERAREIFESLEIRKLREATEQAIHQV